MNSILTFSLIILLQFTNQVPAQLNNNSNSSHNKLTGTELLLQSTDYLFVGSAWQEDKRMTYNYLPVSLLLESKIHESYNAGNWENETQYTYFYQSSNNPYEELIQDWNGSGWIDNWKIDYSYNAISQVETKFTYLWNGVEWIKNDSTYYTYNTYDSLENVYRSFWRDPSWENLTWSLYTYDVGGNLEQLLLKNWNSNITQWENSYRFTFTYDNEYKLFEKIYETWFNNNWTKQLKTNYVYDDNGYGYLTERYLYTWNAGNWAETKLFRYNYGWFQLLDSLTEFDWNGNSWVKHRKTDYSRIIVDVGDDPMIAQEYLLFQNYPNPFNPYTKIKFQIAKAGFTVLKVYDILGNEVTTLVNEEKSAGEYEVEFNGTKLPSGIYFYQLKAGFYVETKKMVLLR